MTLMIMENMGKKIMKDSFRKIMSMTNRPTREKTPLITQRCRSVDSTSRGLARKQQVSVTTYMGRCRQGLGSTVCFSFLALAKSQILNAVSNMTPPLR